MAGLTTSSLAIPAAVSDKIFARAYQGSALAQLAQAEPQKFGTGKVMVLTGAPKAELVGEASQKSPTPATFSSITVNPLKFHVTVRVSDEVMWADEDHMLGVFEEIEKAAGDALGRALDLAAIHKINPLTGSTSQLIAAGLSDTTNSATVSSGAYDAALDAAIAAVMADGYMPTGVAADPAFKFGLSSQRTTTGELKYPGIGLGFGQFDYRGLVGATSSTVGAPEISGGSGVLAIVGQFDALRWGVQREIGAELIEYGDPDGQGDLKRNNQVAIRLEIVYGLGIVDTDAFGKVLAPLA